MRIVGVVQARLGSERLPRKVLADVEGQAAKERLAKRQANAAVALLRLGKPEQVWPVVEAVSKIFRDHGYRLRRNKARFKFLVADWGVERMTEEELLRGLEGLAPPETDPEPE